VIRAGLDCPISPHESADVDASLSRARQLLGEDQYDSAWSEGQSMSLEATIAYARRGRGERKRPSTGWLSLTPTEHEVVTLVADGLRNSDIAARLFMGAGTVKTHLAHIFTKLGIKNRAELAAIVALRRADKSAERQMF